MLHTCKPTLFKQCLSQVSVLEPPVLIYLPVCRSIFQIDMLFEHFILTDGFFHRLLVRAARWSQQKCRNNRPKLYYRYGCFYLEDGYKMELQMLTNDPICVKVCAVCIYSLSNAFVGHFWKLI